MFNQMNEKQIKNKINELETLMTHKEESIDKLNVDIKTLD